MTTLKEEQIRFVGKKSYKEPQNPTDKQILKKLIYDIKEIIDTRINKINNSHSQLQITLNINDDDPNLRFNINYPNYDLYPNKSIKDIGLEIQNKINEILDEYDKYPNFYFDFGPNWNGNSYLSTNLYVRPLRGTFTCPVCKLEIEDSEDNYVHNDLLKENIAICPNTKHKTFFVENFMDSEFQTKSPFKMSENLSVHIIDPNEREHLLLAFQFIVIAKNEYSSFRRPNIHDINSKIYVITEKGIPMGYAYWNDINDDERCFRQIYIRDQFRRKGFGTMLTEKTVEIESKNKIFIIESPNEKSQEILLKLGYVKKNNGKLTGIKCKFIRCA